METEESEVNAESDLEECVEVYEHCAEPDGLIIIILCITSLSTATLSSSLYQYF